MDSVIIHWGIVYADFKREYGVDLLAEWDSLPWWRFMALLSGLSGESGLAAVLGDGGARPRDMGETPPEDLTDASESQVRARLANIVSLPS